MNAEPTTIWDALNKMPGPDRAAVVIISIVIAALLLIVFVTSVSKTIYRMQKNRLDDALKRELVDRGFSADEIVRIMEASATPFDPLPKVRACTKPKETSHAHTG